MVMSSDPCGTGWPSTCSSPAARRTASGTPRVGIPSRTTCCAPLVRSMISWVIRVSARPISACSSTVLPSPGTGRAVPSRPAPGSLARLRVRHQDLLSRLTGRALKDVGPATRYQPGGAGGGRRGRRLPPVIGDGE